MPIFKTQFDPHDRVSAVLGDPAKILYSAKFDDKGVMDLVETGRENLYEYIQSHKESCDIHVILERFARGDVGALERVQGVYGDFSNVPKSYADMLNLVHSAEDAFSRLPVDERAKYGHSFERWLVEFSPALDSTQAPAVPIEKIADVVSPKDSAPQAQAPQAVD